MIELQVGLDLNGSFSPYIGYSVTFVDGDLADYTSHNGFIGLAYSFDRF
jgi:hypothetical protein